MEYLIKARGLTKAFGDNIIVSNIDIDIVKGEIIALIGENGTGKSTTLSMLLGMIKPDRGTIAYWSKDYKKHLGVQLQSTPFFEGYTTEDNIDLFASLYKTNISKEKKKALLAKYDLFEHRKTQASRLSGGQQKKLAIAVTTLHHPQFIVLDEPTAALDPMARIEIKQLIQSLATNGTTILFTSHDLEEVANLATRIIMLNKGHIVANDSPKALLKQHKVDRLEDLYFKLITSEKGEF